MYKHISIICMRLHTCVLFIKSMVVTITYVQKHFHCMYVNTCMYSFSAFPAKNISATVTANLQLIKFVGQVHAYLKLSIRKQSCGIFFFSFFVHLGSANNVYFAKIPSSMPLESH